SALVQHLVRRRVVNLTRAPKPACRGRKQCDLLDGVLRRCGDERIKAVHLRSEHALEIRGVLVLDPLVGQYAGAMNDRRDRSELSLGLLNGVGDMITITNVYAEITCPRAAIRNGGQRLLQFSVCQNRAESRLNF